MPFHQAVHGDSLLIGDVESDIFQFGGFDVELYAVVEAVFVILHYQEELHILLVVEFVAEMHGEGAVLHLGFVDVHAGKGMLALNDLHGRMVAREGDVEVAHGSEADIMQAEVQPAGLVVVGSLVAVAFLVVDFDGIENQIGLVRGDDLDETLVTVIVLLGDGEFHGSSNRLRNDGDLLGAARRLVEADDLTVGGQANGGAFVGLHRVLLVPGGEHG